MLPGRLKSKLPCDRQSAGIDPPALMRQIKEKELFHVKHTTVFAYLIDEARNATTLDQIITARKLLNFALRFCPDLKVSEARCIHEILCTTAEACYKDMEKEEPLYENP